MQTIGWKPLTVPVARAGVGHAPDVARCVLPDDHGGRREALACRGAGLRDELGLGQRRKRAAVLIKVPCGPLVHVVIAAVVKMMIMKMMIMITMMMLMNDDAG